MITIKKYIQLEKDLKKNFNKFLATATNTDLKIAEKELKELTKKVPVIFQKDFYYTFIDPILCCVN